MNARTLTYGLVFRAGHLYYSIKYRILADYIARVDIQAQQLYKESPLFKFRWQEVSLKFAEDAYEQDRFFFIGQVRKGPLLIRLRIFWDFLTGAPYNAYYLTD